MLVFSHNTDIWDIMNVGFGGGTTNIASNTLMGSWWHRKKLIRNNIGGHVVPTINQQTQ